MLGTLVLGFLGNLFSTDNIAKAASSVTLSASGYVDPDAEDIHKASQWVVRDSGATVYDSGEDLVNLTSITISGAIFTNGTTYFWKIRYKDQHDAWSAYSAESSFVYTDGSPTPTPGPSSTASSTSTATSTATSTTTSTATSTSTPTATATSTSVPVCGPTSCIADINIIEVVFNCDTNQLQLRYRMYNSEIALKQNQKLTTKIDKLINDIYISFEQEGNYYHRIGFDVDYTRSYQWVTLPGYNWSYLESTVLLDIPQALLAQYTSSESAQIIIYAYSNVSSSWGDTLSLVQGWQPFAYPSEMADRSKEFKTNCVIKIDDDVISQPCLMEIKSPKNNDLWQTESQADIIWDTDRAYKDSVKKINIALSRDGGKSVSDPLLVRGDNSGFLTVAVLDRYISNKAVLQFIGLDENDEPISYCKSEQFKVKGTFGFGGGGLGSFGHGALSIVLFLGALVSSVPLLLMLIAMVPSISRFLSRLGLLFVPPAWPKEKPAWGIIYDAVSKKPISRAVMRIFSEPDGKQRDIQTSNEKGEFGFLVPRGEYSITASATGFSFPSHVLVADRDGKYTNLYRGGKITISTSSKENIEKAPIMINIPMDPSRMAVLDVAVVGALSFIHKFATIIRVPVMIIGTLASVYLSVEYSRFIDWFILSIYLILWALELRDLLKKKTYGVIVDGKGNPVALSIVRIIDMQGKIITTVVTGDDGKFFTSINAGTYRFDVVKPGYHSTRSKPYLISKIQDLHRVKITIDKIAESEGGIQYRTNISS